MKPLSILPTFLILATENEQGSTVLDGFPAVYAELKCLDIVLQFGNEFILASQLFVLITQRVVRYTRNDCFVIHPSSLISAFL
jgi:hypothetical protein